MPQIFEIEMFLCPVEYYVKHSSEYFSEYSSEHSTEYSCEYSLRSMKIL